MRDRAYQRLMLGTAFETRGGITAVVNAYRSHKPRLPSLGRR